MPRDEHRERLERLHREWADTRTATESRIISDEIRRLEQTIQQNQIDIPNHRFLWEQNYEALLGDIFGSKSKRKAKKIKRNLPDWW